MEYSESILIRLAIFVLGLAGLWVAHHIHKEKKSGRPLVCPINFDCHTVVHSDYSKFLGVPLEIFGMAYYALVSLAYLLFVVVPESMPLAVVNFMIALSLSAFIFSLYLIAIQIFVLKKGCSWCIVSATISAFIFVLTLATYHLDYVLQIFSL